MKIVITGAAGAIGSHLAERFLELGHEVVGIDAFKPFYDPAIKRLNAREVSAKGGKIYEYDLAFDDYDHVLENADIIFHLAGQPGISSKTSFEEYLTDNVRATHRLLKKVRKIPNLKAFIHASTSSVYGSHAKGNEESEPKPTSYYGVTKLAAEQLAMTFHREGYLPVVVLRFFSVYGPRERPEKFYHKLIRSIFHSTPVTLHEGSENHVRSYTYIEDIVSGCELIVNNIEMAVGEIFNLGTDKTMTTGEGIEIIERLTNKKAMFVKTPRREGDQLETGADISKIKKFFGYEPKVRLEDGLQKQIEWYQKTIHNKL